MTRRVGVERIERVVDAAHKQYGSSLLSRHEVITILRRELAKERARVRRIVKAVLAKEMYDTTNKRRLQASLLAAIKGAKK